jgi:3-methyladenine DNA glycosylase/8-oxoguanine DNA glycosylase
LARDLENQGLRVLARAVRRAEAPYDLSLFARAGELFVLRGGERGLAVRIGARLGAPHVDVVIEALGAGDATAEDSERAILAGEGLAGLLDDPRPFAPLARAHPLVADLHGRFRGLRLSRTPTVWESFVRAVVGQLVTFGEARLAVERMKKRWGGPLGATGLYAMPTAEAIQGAPSWAMHECGVGARRAATLRAGAMRAARLEEMRETPADEAIRRMRSIRGVGIWTANSVAMDALGHADAVLVGDAGAPRLVTVALTGRAGGDAEMLACLEPFRPHRARVLSLLYLAQSRGIVFPGLEPRPLPRIDRHRRMPWRY